MAEPNSLLDALIAESGMSRQGLARRVNAVGADSGYRLRYDHTSVGRWLNGQLPRAHVRELICQVLGSQLGRTVSSAELGLAPPMGVEAIAPLDRFIGRATAMWRADNLRRLELEEADFITGNAAIEPVWTWENPPEDIDVSRSGPMDVRPYDVQVLRDARAHYEAMYRTVGGPATHGRIATFLAHYASPLLHGSHGDALGRDLHRAIGGLTALAGITSYDTERHALAQRYFHQSLRLAKSSGDRDFGAYTLALMVNQALALNDARQAVAFAEAALRSAGPNVSPALAADLHVMQAKAYAQLGDHGRAYASINLAEAAASRIGEREEPAETGYVEPGLIDAQVAEALFDLGDLEPADSYAQAAIGPAAHTRGQVNRLATVTTIALKRGEADRAAAHAIAMVDRAQSMESRRLAGRFLALRTHMASLSSKDTSTAIDRIDRWLAVPSESI